MRSPARAVSGPSPSMRNPWAIPRQAAWPRSGWKEGSGGGTPAAFISCLRRDALEALDRLAQESGHRCSRPGGRVGIDIDQFAAHQQRIGAMQLEEEAHAAATDASGAHQYVDLVIIDGGRVILERRLPHE